MTEELEQAPTCRTCGITLFWARNERTGHWLPLELVPTAYRVGEGAAARTARAMEGPVFISHFLTCPDREKFSHRGRRRGEGRRLP
jgi:hypothetical protein